MKTIQIRTAIPGPRSQELMKRRNQAVPKGAYHATPIFVARTEGASLEDVDGNRFIDFTGGIGCLNTGHRAQPVLERIRAQAEKFLHTCFSVTPYESYVRVAERLNVLVPGEGVKKTLLLNTGAEAVENAVKLARCYTKRPAIICFEDGFHGRSYMAMTLTSKTNPYKSGFGPFMSDVYRVPFAYCYRCSFGLKYPSCALACAWHLEDTFKRVVAADSVAAIIVEPVLGEGGFIAPPQDYFQVLHEICRKHGILLIADEVQTGMGRTGYTFASEYYGIKPDLLVAAKSLGGGLPLASVTGRAEIMDSTVVGGLGGTFAGNPLSCEAALAVLDMMEDRSLCKRAQELGKKFSARAREWQQELPMIGEVRGLGAMQAIELVKSPETKQPADEETKAVAKHCYERGVILITAGSYNNIIRTLMPLVITDEQFDEAMDVIEDAFFTVLGKKALVGNRTA